ncbi:MAG: hypothetical protein KC443_04865 [Anaerolineales bacterium]|nr:hypothetical protein [Anaerolineales bacterium]
MYTTRPRIDWEKQLIRIVLGWVMLVLTACSLLNRDASAATLGHDTQLEIEAITTCSQSCRERGQCGTTAEQGTVVLGGVFQPLTNSHDMFFPIDTRVSINGVTPYVLRQVSDGQQFSINFYNVIAPDGKSGWVAGWCLAAPQ